MLLSLPHACNYTRRNGHSFVSSTLGRLFVHISAYSRFHTTDHCSHKHKRTADYTRTSILCRRHHKISSNMVRFRFYRIPHKVINTDYRKCGSLIHRPPGLVWAECMYSNTPNESLLKQFQPQQLNSSFHCYTFFRIRKSKWKCCCFYSGFFLEIIVIFIGIESWNFLKTKILIRRQFWWFVNDFQSDFKFMHKFVSSWRYRTVSYNSFFFF